MPNAALETTTIPGTNLTPSRIALGTWAIGGWMWGGSDDQESIRTIRSAIDRGITIIDTAPVYGFGHAEEIVGQALAESGQRHNVLIATKVGLDWRDGAPFRNASKARIQKEIEDSLRRLRTDVIDLYQVHWPDPGTPIEETAKALAELYRAGKAAPLHTVQPPHNLFEREAEKDILPYCRDKNITTLAYGSLCRGLLSGRMKADSSFTGDDLRRTDPKFQAQRMGQYLRAVERLDTFAQEKYSKRVLHLAVRWVLDQQPLSIALWGARHPDQLDPVTEVMGWKLDSNALTEIDRILADCIGDPVGPEFMAPPTRSAA
ncbi:MAG: aldo/keto reductase [Beijerinckiaceae bacterium]